MSKLCTPIRLWIAAAVVLGAIAISLMGVVIHLKASESSCAEDEESTHVEKYLYLFRSEEDQKAIEDVIPDYIINHACCKSNQIATTPTSAFTIYNTNVTVIQDVPIMGNRFNQYFLVDNCTMSSCSLNCNCENQVEYFTAYVKYPDTGKSNISQIRLPACCKCVNH